VCRFEKPAITVWNHQDENRSENRLWEFILDSEEDLNAWFDAFSSEIKKNSKIFINAKRDGTLNEVQIIE
jgi:hypothetical protein